MKEPTRNKYALTEAQFEDVRDKIRRKHGRKIGDASIEAAYAVMVRDQPVMAVASARHKTRQNIYRAVRDVWALAMTDEVEPPSDWVRVVVWLPPEIAKRVEAMAVSAREELTRSKDSES